MESVCYHGIGNERDVLCGDLPPNRARFLGWWHLSPERHFWEWVGFVVVGLGVVLILGPKTMPPRLQRSAKLPSHTAAGAASAFLAPRFWMKTSTLLFYPYVAYTKLSWPGSNYPGRWLMFVGMPVGTLWILSVLFCFCASPFASLVSSVWMRGERKEQQRRGYGNTNHNSTTAATSSKHALALDTIRYGLLETWLSFLPLLVDLLPSLCTGAVSSLRNYASGIDISSGRDGDNASIAYFCHGLYLVCAPVYCAVCWKTSDEPPLAVSSLSVSRWTAVALGCFFRQLVGTSVCAVYYMGVVTPASIVAGLNVNFLLDDGRGGGSHPNFRIACVARWFLHGCTIRGVLAVVVWCKEHRFAATTATSMGCAAVASRTNEDRSNGSDDKGL